MDKLLDLVDIIISEIFPGALIKSEACVSFLRSDFFMWRAF
jgi:hypothetical protein